MKIKIPRLERTLAVFSHYDGCQRLTGDDEGDIRIVIVEEGWFWVIPFRGDRTSVGVVLEPNAVARATGDLDRLLDEIIDAYPVMQGIMRGREKCFRPARRRISSYRVAEASGAGWLSVGDAAGFIDPSSRRAFTWPSAEGRWRRRRFRMLSRAAIFPTSWTSYERMVKEGM